MSQGDSPKGKTGDQFLAWFAVVAVLSASAVAALNFLQPKHTVSATAGIKSGMDTLAPPTLGTVVPLPDVDMNGLEIPSDQDLFVIGLGDCESCSIQRFDLSRMPLELDHPVVFLLFDSADEWAGKIADSGMTDTFIVSVPDSSVYPDTLSVSAPMAVRLDEQRRVIDSGPNSFYPDRFVKGGLHS